MTSSIHLNNSLIDSRNIASTATDSPSTLPVAVNTFSALKPTDSNPIEGSVMQLQPNLQKNLKVLCNLLKQQSLKQTKKLNMLCKRINQLEEKQVSKDDVSNLLSCYAQLKNNHHTFRRLYDAAYGESTAVEDPFKVLESLNEVNRKELGEDPIVMLTRMQKHDSKVSKTDVCRSVVIDDSDDVSLSQNDEFAKSFNDSDPSELWLDIEAALDNVKFALIQRLSKNEQSDEVFLKDVTLPQELSHLCSLSKANKEFNAILDKKLVAFEFSDEHYMLLTFMGKKEGLLNILLPSFMEALMELKDHTHDLELIPLFFINWDTMIKRLNEIENPSDDMEGLLKLLNNEEIKDSITFALFFQLASNAECMTKEKTIYETAMSFSRLRKHIILPYMKNQEINQTYTSALACKEVITLPVFRKMYLMIATQKLLIDKKNAKQGTELFRLFQAIGIQPEFIKNVGVEDSDKESTESKLSMEKFGSNIVISLIANNRFEDALIFSSALKGEAQEELLQFSAVGLAIEGDYARAKEAAEQIEDKKVKHGALQKIEEEQARMSAYRYVRELREQGKDEQAEELYAQESEKLEQMYGTSSARTDKFCEVQYLLLKSSEEQAISLHEIRRAPSVFDELPFADSDHREIQLLNSKAREELLSKKYAPFLDWIKTHTKSNTIVEGVQSILEWDQKKLDQELEKAPRYNRIAVDFLAAAGANIPIHVRTRSYESLRTCNALSYAVKSNNKQILNRVLEQLKFQVEADGSEEARYSIIYSLGNCMVQALHQNDTETFKTLLSTLLSEPYTKSKPKRILNSIFYSRNNNSSPMMMVAAMKNNHEAVKLMIDALLDNPLFKDVDRYEKLCMLRAHNASDTKAIDSAYNGAIKTNPDKVKVITELLRICTHPSFREYDDIDELIGYSGVQLKGGLFHSIHKDNPAFFKVMVELITDPRIFEIMVKLDINSQFDEEDENSSRSCLFTTNKERILNILIGGMENVPESPVNFALRHDQLDLIQKMGACVISSSDTKEKRTMEMEKFISKVGPKNLEAMKEKGLDLQKELQALVDA